MAQAVTGHIPAVAVGGENGLAYAGAGEEVRKNGVHQPVNVCVDIPAMNPLLVVGGGGSDSEIVALISVQRNLWF